MNIQEYIESGVLEMYALGVCSAEEKAEVETMLANHPELKSELLKIEDTLGTFAQTQAVEPSAALKSRVMSSIQSDRTGSVSNMQITSSATKFNWKMVAAAACILFVGSASFNLVLLKRYNDTKETLLASEEQKSVMADQLKSTQTSSEKAFAALDLVNDTSTVVVRMKGMPISPDSRATVYWNRNSSEVYLSVNDLPTPPTGKQYQLWAIVGSAPVDAGVFDVLPSAELQKMNSFDEAVAFAVTLEPVGGSVSPTLDQMIVSAGL